MTVLTGVYLTVNYPDGIKVDTPFLAEMTPDEVCQMLRHLAERKPKASSFVLTAAILHKED